MGGRRERARGEYRFSSLVKQKQKGGKLRSLLIRRKKIFLCIYDVIVKQKKKRSTIHYLHMLSKLTPTSLAATHRKHTWSHRWSGAPALVLQ